MTGTWVDIAFGVFAVAAAWFGWRVFVTDSMVRATFSLLASFLNVGAILVLLLAEYLGVAMFFMMGVEMTVMAIYMVAFMMNPAGLNPMQMVHQPRVAVVVGVLSTAGFGAVALAADLDTVAIVDPDGTIRALGHELMGSSMLVMQVVGVTLVATMVGAVVLSAASGRFGPADVGSVPPAIVPGDDTTRPGVDVGGDGGGHDHDHGHGGGAHGHDDGGDA
ncbi:NADH-quinone oxidoreductase subunit J [Salsipaludibacter albus]|uniref:NADH-quinone oxidoreductase subunit J n=1 Tax=Salsipaludibacter albus TaxID=2849650 RepID=UPI001EE3A61D|nr:NADH-quinone oxidoreductase subunit J [Salsipaludibacter albus]MBY5161389.1 NADH-quinone oxidoreductase subunit J [Salsipaludibacter albus]